MTRRANLCARAHAWIAPALAPGATALDATCGNGHDTRFLAESVAPGGCVHAFDVQRDALASARKRLTAAPGDVAIVWHQRDHSDIAAALGDGVCDAAMFNLGWLPGGDPTCITRPKTTVAALAGALAVLRPGGRLTVVCYRGHPGGAAEAEAVTQWLARTPCAHLLAAEPAILASAEAPQLNVITRRR